MSKKKVSPRKKLKYAFTSSLKTQITTIYVLVMAFTLITSWVVTYFFMERYYINRQEKTLRNLYYIMQEESSKGIGYSDAFDLRLQQYSAANNVGIVIISASLEPIKVYANESEDTIIHDALSKLSHKWLVDEIIEQTDDYIMVRDHENRLQTDYIEMVGRLNSGSVFLTRVAVESIRNSVNITVHFMIQIGVGAMLISTLIIYFVTRRVSRPILELAEISEKMSAMDFGTKYKGKSKNEISLLGNNINDMSEKLEKTISELKEANLRLQQDIDLKTQIDEMRKEFISNVSHELKTPIALIQGYSEGLKECINDDSDRDYYCDVIMDEAAKLNKMVKQLLSLNQLEAGYYDLELSEFDIMSLVKNYIQSADVLTRGKDIKVSVFGPKTQIVLADEFKVEEAIMNFFSNAVNHCESDAQKRIDVYVENVENKVKVSVFNTGKNIPQDSIEHIWEKFYKVDKARTRAYGGSGVGLSIVKAIAEAHNCSCGVENLEEGVSFWITFNLPDNDDSEGKNDNEE